MAAASAGDLGGGSQVLGGERQALKRRALRSPIATSRLLLPNTFLSCLSCCDFAVVFCFSGMGSCTSADPREAQSRWCPLTDGSWQTAVRCWTAHKAFALGGLTEAQKGLWTQDSDRQGRGRGCRLSQQLTAYQRQTAGGVTAALGRALSPG